MTFEQRMTELRRRIREAAPHIGALTYGDAAELLYLEGVETRDGWSPDEPLAGPPYTRVTLDKRINELREEGP